MEKQYGETNNYQISDRLDDVRAANEGDPLALKRLQEWIQSTPGLVEAMGNRAAVAQDILLQVLHSDHELDKSVTKAYMDQLKEGMTNGSRDPLDQIASDRVVTNWLMTTLLEIGLANVMRESLKAGDEQTFAFNERRVKAVQGFIGQAQKRLNDSVRLVRELQDIRVYSRNRVPMGRMIAQEGERILNEGS